MNNYRLKIILPFSGFIIFVVLFFTNPSAINAGVRNGLTLCGTTVIPSLFPFMVVSDYLVRSGLCSAMGHSITKATQKLFCLPGCAGCVIFMSLIGGFPVGAKMTAQLIEEKQIPLHQGKRMMLFCLNPGPAFTVSAIGITMLGSKKAGIILYISLVVSSLIAGFVTRFFHSEKAETSLQIYTKPDYSVIAQSVRDSVSAMLNICAWVLIFSAANGYICSVNIPKKIRLILTSLGEVTNACEQTAGKYPLFIIAFIVAWAGFSVHCQIYSYLKKAELKIIHFWIFRLFVALLTGAICFVLSKLFPCEINVFAEQNSIILKPYSVSVPAGIAMLVLGCFTLLDNDLARDKKI